MLWHLGIRKRRILKMKTSDIRTELMNWKFTIDQTGYGDGAGFAGKRYDDSSWSDVVSNTSWETYEYAMQDYEGRAWFRTRFTPQTKGMRYILHFDGVGGVARVYVNGHYVGGTENRYLPFEVDATDVVWANGENTVAVMVDNSFRGKEHLTGGTKIEWVLYGGLTHRVYLVERPKTHVEHVFLKADADGSMKVRVKLKTFVPGPKFSGKLALSVDGLDMCYAEQPVALAAATTVSGDIGAEMEFAMQAEGHKCWSPDAPNLYNLKVSLYEGDKVYYEVTERFGFRTISVEGTNILLNGEEILLKGANRYDEYAPYGICPPADVIREDLLEMKKCGMNLVRTHYPQDPIHYEIADEIGMMYMIEVPLNWWNPAENDTLADHMQLAAEAVDCLDRTFFWHCNHPSWVIWSTGNECAHSHRACQELFRILAERMRGLDCGRLVTYAANKPLRDSKELDFCDILSMNYYSGILSNSVEDFPEQLHTVLKKKMDLAQELYPNVPHMMSEFGYCCPFGVHGSETEGRYTEDFGATFLKAKCAELLYDKQMRGLIIWCWADYRHRRGFVSRKGAMGFQATYGPYGLVSMDRKPKKKLLQTMVDVFRNWTL